MLQNTLDQLHQIVEFSKKSNEWDEMPMLFVLTTKGTGICLLAGEMEVYQMVQMAGPQIREAGVLNDPDMKVTGLILMAEAYALKSDKKTDPLAEKLQEEVDALRDMGMRFGDHPSSVEIKMFYAIDNEGMASASFDRDGDTKETLGDGVGRIPDAMQSLWNWLVEA